MSFRDMLKKNTLIKKVIYGGFSKSIMPKEEYDDDLNTCFRYLRKKSNFLLLVLTYHRLENSLFFSILSHYYTVK